MTTEEEERVLALTVRDQCRAAMIDSLEDIARARKNLEVNKVTARDVVVIQMVLLWAEGEVLFQRGERKREGT